MTDKAKRYARIRYRLAIVEFLYLLLLLAFFQISGLAVLLKVFIENLLHNQAALISFYCSVMFGLYLALNFPLVFYGSYIVEHRFGLSREKFSPWFFDYIKANLITLLFFTILTGCFIYSLRYHPNNWWWMSSIFWMCFSIVLARIFPVLIIPLFFKYKRIDNEDLRRRILNLSDKMGIKILDIYQIDFSKKSVKGNAALVGLGKSKRVILTDTLEGRFSPDEIEGILAHEFAHFRLKHMIKLILINAAATLVIFFTLFKISPPIFGLFGLNLGDIAGLGIWISYFALIQIIFVPLVNFISRRMEANADILAIKFSEKSETFVSMLEKLAEQNLAERRPSILAKVFFYDHPPIDERIATAKGRA